MRLNFLLPGLFLLSGLTHAQTDLERITLDLESVMTEVMTAKVTYQQSLSVQADKPYVLVYHLTTLNQKGKSNEEKWIFNLATIDPKTVRVEDSKDELRVRLRVEGGQKFIQYYRSGELSSYTDQCVFYGQDIDNARALEALLLEAQPLARALWQEETSLRGKSDDELMQLLVELVGDVSGNGTFYRQKLSPAGDYPDRLRLELGESSSRGNKQESLTWSLGDLNAKEVRLQISGDKALVEASTRSGLDWVGVEQDGEKQDFINEVEIRVANAEQGQRIVSVLEQLIPFGEKEVQKRLPDVQHANANELFDLLTANLGAFSAGKTEYKVTLEPNCLSRLTEKAGEKVTEYQFHLGDLDPKSVSLDMDHDLLEISVSTEGKKDFIAVMQGGEQQNYTDVLEIRLGDLEKGRLVAYLLPTLIDQCPEETEVGSLTDAAGWISEGIAPETDIRQTLSLQSDEDPCKWKYVWRNEDEKKPEESVYEFNAYDLDPEQVRIEVSKKSVSVQVQTLKKQNIISSLVREKPGFVSGLSFEVADIQAAKSLRFTLERLILGCPQPAGGN